jgi:hypothetical protein
MRPHLLLLLQRLLRRTELARMHRAGQLEIARADRRYRHRRQLCLCL